MPHTCTEVGNVVCTACLQIDRSLERCTCCDLPLYSCGLAAERRERSRRLREESWEMDGW